MSARFIGLHAPKRTLWYSINAHHAQGPHKIRHFGRPVPGPRLVVTHP